ncbi:MAG: stage II sporulation protein R [Ruminococcaceae bacterium]|nr:stage II sporulation protein R [Oscillospiraceae bacterium]
MQLAKKVLILCIVCMAAMLLVTVLPVHGEEEIYDSVVRLHVLANSDSEEDQALKLQVRDEILLITAPILKECKTQDQAKEILSAAIPDIKAAAEKKIASLGYNYPVEVLLDNEYYPTKEYESCAFPEGEYLSLRVIIGEGEGQNWWCCLFPPLCLSGATSKVQNEDAFISVGLSTEQYKIITETNTPKYKVRFKILEVFQRAFK